MCRWGCQTVDTTYMCRWCGTRYCAQCLRGDFKGLMKSSEKCRICFQDKCQGVRVEFKPQKRENKPEKKQNSEKTNKTQKSKVSAKTKKKSQPQKKKRKKRK